MMTDFLLDFGRPIIKSIEMSIHYVGGIGNGFKAPKIYTIFPLFHWQVSHFAKNVMIYFFMPSQKKECLACA